jgi:hypothetical protein
MWFLGKTGIPIPTVAGVPDMSYDRVVHRIHWNDALNRCEKAAELGDRLSALEQQIVRLNLPNGAEKIDVSKFITC